MTTGRRRVILPAVPTRFGHRHDPWCVAVPVVPSTFVALHRRHRRYNLEIDLAAVGPFSFQRAGNEAGLLWADLQLGADGNSRRRLGSGRAGFVDGAYVKGPGRTLLAGHWADDEDRRNNSGHLLPSAAIREYLISRYLEAKGLGQTIHPCEGLLFRPLPAGAAAMVLRSFPGRRKEGVAPVDRAFQALSVKGDGFARWGNLAWLAHHHLPAHGFVGELLHRSMVYLERRAVAAEEVTPASFAAALSAAVERGYDHFVRWFSIGLHWGSVYGNLTADGRFLDLEVPTLLGAPALGVLRTRGARGRPVTSGSSWMGLEVLRYARHARAFVIDLAARLQLLGDELLAHPLARRFATSAAAELRAAFAGSRTFSEPALRRATVAMLADGLGLGGDGRRQAAKLVQQRLDHLARAAVEPWTGSLRPVGPRLAPTEPLIRFECSTPSWASSPDGDGLEEGRLVNRVIEGVEAAGSLDELRGRIGEAAAAIQRACRPVAAAPR